MKKAFTVLFEDQYILVVNKIARVVIQPVHQKKEVNLTSLIRREISRKVYPCHRLDKDTQGLIIYAKSLSVWEGIVDQFRKRKILKKYLALSRGNFKKKQGIFKSSIIDKQGKKFKEKPKKAETEYKVLKRCKGFDFLEIIPKSGRTNQIRIHLSEAGHPILGEKKYAFRRDFMIKSNKLALVACFLKFEHPLTQKKVELKIAIPEYINEFLKKWG